MKYITTYPLKNTPKAWHEAIRFHGCGRSKDAQIVYGRAHSGIGYYIYCRNYPEEGMDFLGNRKSKRAGNK